MRILTLDNTYYDLDHLPEEVDDMRFAILDNSNPQDPDYHFIPLIFLESFNAPALVLRYYPGMRLAQRLGTFNSAGSVRDSFACRAFSSREMIPN